MISKIQRSGWEWQGGTPAWCTRPKSTGGGIMFENDVMDADPAILSEGHYTLSSFH